MPSTRRLAAIMFTDLVGFTQLGQRDEEQALRLRAEHQTLLRPLFSAYGGREIKTLGDGFLVEFSSAVESVRCAVEIQSAATRRNALASSEGRIVLRVGIHVGDVVEEGGDIVGDAVNVASRIEPLAEPGGICVSGSVFDQVRNKLPWALEKVGSRTLKNVEFPVDIYRVALGAETARPAATNVWEPVPDPEGRFSTGIPTFDRLLGGGFRRGSMALFGMDETVGTEDLDLLLFPTLLNMLLQSRGMLAVLPSRDSPHDFRARLTRYMAPRKFDGRVRICDYVGEDEGLPYVVNLNIDKGREKATAQVVAAEKVVAGKPKGPFIELTSFEVFETLVGPAGATKLYFQGVKRVRMIGNLGIGLLGPGLGCASGVRRMVDTEFELHREQVGLVLRGIRPAFPSYIVTPDHEAGPPHVVLLPRPS